MTKARVVSLSELGGAEVIQVIEKELPPRAKAKYKFVRPLLVSISLMSISAQVITRLTCLQALAMRL